MSPHASPGRARAGPRRARAAADGWGPEASFSHGAVGGASARVRPLHRSPGRPLTGLTRVRFIPTYRSLQCTSLRVNYCSLYLCYFTHRTRYPHYTSHHSLTLHGGTQCSHPDPGRLDATVRAQHTNTCSVHMGARDCLVGRPRACIVRCLAAKARSTRAFVWV